MKKNYPSAPAGIRTRNLSITSPALLPTNYPGSLSAPKAFLVGLRAADALHIYTPILADRECRGLCGIDHLAPVFHATRAMFSPAPQSRFTLSATHIKPPLCLPFSQGRIRKKLTTSTSVFCKRGKQRKSERTEKRRYSGNGSNRHSKPDRSNSNISLLVSVLSSVNHRGTYQG